jgi:hypothetical protein
MVLSRVLISIFSMKFNPIKLGGSAIASAVTARAPLYVELVCVKAGYTCTCAIIYSYYILYVKGM